MPFLISIVLVGIGLWIRLGILETPTFRRLVEEDRIERAPIAEVFRLQAKEVFFSAFARMAEQAPFYIFTAFIFAYGTGTLKVSRDLLLAAVLVASIVSFFSIPIAGHLSDRFGRRRVYILGAVLTGIFGWVYFMMLDTMVPFWIFAAIVVSLIPHDIIWPAGGTDRGKLHRSCALYRCVDRLSARIHHRRRARAVDRDRPVRQLSLLGGDCRLHLRMCCRQRGFSCYAEGLHREGHLCGICLR